MDKTKKLIEIFQYPSIKSKLKMSIAIFQLFFFVNLIKVKFLQPDLKYTLPTSLILKLNYIVIRDQE